MNLGREKGFGVTVMTKNQTRSILPSALLAFALVAAGCTQNSYDYGTKETVGTLSGAALGGWAGAQIGDGDGQLAATAAGALIGAFLGNQIGQGLDDVDRLQVQQAQARAQSAPIGDEIQWNNPNSGNSGSVIATREGTSSSGRYCREFQHTVFIDGKAERGYGTACQEPDGSWEII